MLYLRDNKLITKNSKLCKTCCEPGCCQYDANSDYILGSGEIPEYLQVIINVSDYCIDAGVSIDCPNPLPPPTYLNLFNKFLSSAHNGTYVVQKVNQCTSKYYVTGGTPYSKVEARCGSCLGTVIREANWGDLYELTVSIVPSKHGVAGRRLFVSFTVGDMGIFCGSAAFTGCINEVTVPGGYNSDFPDYCSLGPYSEGTAIVSKL
jgi:hypothetical protein